MAGHHHLNLSKSCAWHASTRCTCSIPMQESSQIKHPWIDGCRHATRTIPNPPKRLKMGRQAPTQRLLRHQPETQTNSPSPASALFSSLSADVRPHVAVIAWRPHEDVVPFAGCFDVSSHTKEGHTYLIVALSATHHPSQQTACTGQPLDDTDAKPS